jgi:hypothetical protein
MTAVQHLIFHVAYIKHSETMMLSSYLVVRYTAVHVPENRKNAYTAQFVSLQTAMLPDIYEMLKNNIRILSHYNFHEVKTFSFNDTNLLLGENHFYGMTQF